jgi:hypothetical protein
MDFVARILDRWRAEGTRLSPGATPDQLARLARILGVPCETMLRRPSSCGHFDERYDRAAADTRWPEGCRGLRSSGRHGGGGGIKGKLASLVAGATLDAPASVACGR